MCCVNFLKQKIQRKILLILLTIQICENTVYITYTHKIFFENYMLYVNSMLGTYNF
jgi:hypothetical protein